MAKLGSFFRRLFSPSADMTSPTTPLHVESSPKLVVFPSSAMTSEAKISKALEVTNPSRSSSPCPSTAHTMIKQTTVTVDGSETSPRSNFLSSHTQKTNDRRLSAPMIIHTSVPSHQPFQPAVVDETTEEALISSLQRFSLSTPTATSSSVALPTTMQSNHSLGPSRSGSISASLQRPDTRSASFHLSPSPSNSQILPSSLSNNLLNNVASASGTPPSHIVFAAQSSSPRVSIPSNNSPSYQGGMKDISPASETILNSTNDRKMSLPARGRRPSMFDPIDPKELQQALYASAAAKASIPSKPAEEEDTNRAISRMKICYDRESEHIYIDSLSFENLHNLDGLFNSSTSPSNNSSSTNSNNPNNGNNQEYVVFYCRFRLLPGKRSLFQTKIIRHSRSQPTYFFDMKQINEFEITYDQLNNHAIEILVYKVGTIKPAYKDTRIASVKFDLAELAETDQISKKKVLEECDPSSTIQDPDLGDLLVSLSYLQSAAKLAVVVLEAKNLRPLSLENKPYPEACVKVTLIDRNGKKIKRKKTTVQKASDCPTFNEELVFELKRDIAQEVMIELRIVHESLSYKEQLGAVVFGPMINNMTKGFVSPENVYWSTILSGESLNAQWQILKPPVRLEETK